MMNDTFALAKSLVGSRRCRRFGSRGACTRRAVLAGTRIRRELDELKLSKKVGRLRRVLNEDERYNLPGWSGFPTIAAFHCSCVSRISSFDRHTCERVSSPPSITSRSSHPSWCDHSSHTAWRARPQICLWRRQPSPRGAGGPTQSGR